MSYCFKKRSAYLVIIVSFTVTSFSQQGIAPNGCYPSSYQGSIFTGEVVDGPLDVLTLKDKEIFTGRFDAPCQVPTKDGKLGAMLPSDIPLGSKVTVFYYGNASKADGKAAKENIIIRINFIVSDGKVIPEGKRRVFICTNQVSNIFKAFDVTGRGSLAVEPQGCHFTPHEGLN